ncbi:DUF6510 family protein [Microbacterium sp. NPDC089189]|uniref:DUF6510 family protein n=1 Tax=Microbacterium sp. NPDC089189 TaxID=3154972 RepID=UPI003442C1BB
MDSTPRSPIDPRRVAQRVDGNALAGMLQVFAGVDPGTLVVECGHCGASAPLAEWSVERDAQGAIVRCRACTRTLCTFLVEGGRVILRTAAGAVSVDGD